MPIGLNNNNARTFQQKIRKQPGTVIIPEKLYLTSITEAQSLNYLKKNKITAILTINTEPVEIPEELNKIGIKTKFVNLGDNCTSHIKSYFDEMNEFIDNNERVLVHCHAGISRSATAVIAYVMKTLRMTLNEAMKFVQTRRHVVCPNFSFMGQLRSYQDDLQIQQLEEKFMQKHQLIIGSGQIDKTISLNGFIPMTDANEFINEPELMMNDLKAETKIISKNNNNIKSVFSKLELTNKDHDSGVDTSESSNESPLSSPKYKIQKIEYPKKINSQQQETLKLQN
jgi:protein-tyrosine phosphatase